MFNQPNLINTFVYYKKYLLLIAPPASKVGEHIFAQRGPNFMTFFDRARKKDPFP